jgi:uncharacterized protein YegJ (DUF2314 family)
MSTAIQQARESLDQFLNAFASPLPNQSNFHLRVRVTGRGPSGESTAEHLWLTLLDLSTNPPTGAIASEPYLPGFTYLQRVPFLLQQVSDWLYVESGRAVGAYTVRVLRGEPPLPTSRFTMLRNLCTL